MTSPHSAFITGINGFVGIRLAGYLASQGWTVSGIDQQDAATAPDYTYYKADIQAGDKLLPILAACRPACIFHLAAVSMPSAVDQSPHRALSVNIMGTVALLDAVRSTAPAARLLIVGSSKQYGDIEGSLPVDENHPCHPVDLYGISKQTGEIIGLHYAGMYGMDIRFARSFNHSGAGQSPAFVCSDWARQVAAIELGRAEPAIRVGNLDSAIDLCDVADIVRAYPLILSAGRPGTIYNVSSGKAVSLRTLLAHFLKKTSRSVAVIEDPSRLRGRRTAAPLIGDHTKISRDTGWEPRVPIEQTVDELFRFWMAELSSNRS
jgi:GDP-4-dehydro-6-deoxy-D-mannose reductase